ARHHGRADAAVPRRAVRRARPPGQPEPAGAAPPALGGTDLLRSLRRSREPPERAARGRRGPVDAAGPGPRGRASVTRPLAVRAAAAADVAAILGLVHGIGEYERLSHEVEATEALLHRHGFGPRPVFEALLAEELQVGDGARAVGFALYFFTFSTFKARPTLYLEDLFVLPTERRHGVGRRLL